MNLNNFINEETSHIYSCLLQFNAKFYLFDIKKNQKYNNYRNEINPNKSLNKFVYFFNK